jgi:branched-subunit amino acid transport protein
MRDDVLTLALSVGALTWAFRYLPLRMSLQSVRPGSALGRFLAATGTAAIATLFVAEALPYLRAGPTEWLPLAAGLATVTAVYLWRKSVVLATLAGSAMFGATVFLAAP